MTELGKNHRLFFLTGYQLCFSVVYGKITRAVLLQLPVKIIHGKNGYDKNLKTDQIKNKLTLLTLDSTDHVTYICFEKFLCLSVLYNFTVNMLQK